MTVFGAAGTAPTNYGLNGLHLRGYSDVVSGGGAFSTGAGVGVTSTAPFPGIGPFNGAQSGPTTVADSGSTTTGKIPLTSTLDGIIDFGARTNTLNDFVIATGSSTVMASSAGIAGVGPNVGGWTFEVATFKFTTGANIRSGAETDFWPTQTNSGTGAIIVQDGTQSDTVNVANSSELPGTPLRFVTAQATGTTISVTPATDVASVLKGGAISLSKTVNNTGGTALAAGDYTFAASGGTLISYTAMPSVPIPAPGSANFNTTAATTPGTAGTPIGVATVTFTATGTGSAISNSPQTATTSLNVGGAIADNSNPPGVYGPAISAVVGPSGSYAGLESAVVGLQGTGGSNAAVVPFAAPWLGGDAKILAGASTSATARTVSMSWRTRLVTPATGGSPLDETHGGPGSALQITTSTTGLISNVVNVTGLETGSPNPGSTDPFVLDMTYNPALLPKGGTLEAGLAANKLIYMVSPTPGPDNGTSQYVNTVALNTGNVITSPLDSRYGYVGSYAAFQADPLGGNGGTPVSELGAWGVDTSLHEVWAVVDHNSTFAVVPEPATILLAGLGLLGLFGLRRAKKA